MTGSFIMFCFKVFLEKPKLGRAIPYQQNGCVSSSTACGVLDGGRAGMGSFHGALFPSFEMCQLDATG